MVSGLNHALHHGYNYKSDGKKKDPPKYKYKGKIYEDKVKLYGAILIDQAADQFGITDILALGAAISGAPILETSGKFAGATKGTSIASKYLSKIPGISCKITRHYGLS